MFSLAIQDGAITVNPVRDAVAAVGRRAKAPRALTVDETAKLVSLLRASEHANELDIPDLVDWMLATGCRIGEALALRYVNNGDGRPLLDLDAGTWEVNATVVRVAGQGLIVQPRAKTEAGWRVVALPTFAVERVRARAARWPEINAGRPVFAAPIARGLRDPTNVSGDLRQLLDSFECEACGRTGYQVGPGGGFALGPRGRRLRCDEGPWSWVTSHTFRKTVATRLDEAGFTPRQVADQLGHANRP
jgi:integrase